MYSSLQFTLTNTVFLISAEKVRLEHLVEVAGNVGNLKKEALTLQKDISVLLGSLKEKRSALHSIESSIKNLNVYLNAQRKLTLANKFERLYKVAILKKKFTISSSFSASQPATSCANCSKNVSLSPSEP